VNRHTVLVSLLFFYCLYSAFVYTKGTELADQATLSTTALEGRQVWQRYNCVACHQLFGLGGYIGTDLTHVISEKGPAYVTALINFGTTRMPQLGLSDQEVSALVEFLMAVDKAPTTPGREAQFSWYGMPQR